MLLEPLDADVVILKVINPPSLQDFDALIADTRRKARQAGLRKRDVLRAIKKRQQKTLASDSKIV